MCGGVVLLLCVHCRCWFWNYDDI